MFDWGPILLTFQLASITTLILFIVAIPLSNWLAFSNWKGKAVIETLVSMPLVLPPTVIGFYFLLVFSPNSTLGSFFSDHLGIPLVFSFPGLVLASLFYSLPFMIHPIQSGLANLPENLRAASYTLGKSKRATLFKVLLPNIKPSLLTGIVLTFAHTIGEFGIVLMIGGNIPGKTKVASIAIYDEVEALNYELANQYSLLLFVLSFSILLVVYYFNNSYMKSFWRG